jgi:hypothetical protein
MATTLITSNQKVSKVRCENILLGSWGFRINVKFGFLNSKDYKTKDVKRAIEVSMESERSIGSVFTGALVGSLFGPAGAIGGIIGGAMMKNNSGTFAIQFTDGLEVVIAETDDVMIKKLRELTAMNALDAFKE